MIISITLNPSIDIAYQLGKFEINDVNRVYDVNKTPGGKGLNVARVIKQMGGDVRVSGFVGGHFGNYLKSGLDKLEIEHKFYEVEGETRSCIAILHEAMQTEILEPGPEINKKDELAFINFFDEMLKNVDVVTISGSLPKGISSNYYSSLISLCNKKGIKVVLDCSQNALLEVLMGDAKPNTIKPNVDELDFILKKLGKSFDLKNSKDLFSELKIVLSDDVFKGIENVIVSLGGKGSYARCKDNFYRIEIPKVEVVSPVGSGDSTVAGLALSIAQNRDMEYALKLANTLGVLNAMEKQTGYVNIENFEKIYNQIKIVKESEWQLRKIT